MFEKEIYAFELITKVHIQLFVKFRHWFYLLIETLGIDSKIIFLAQQH
jgi:hypothetical protein